jgi:hypothetical protein
MRAAREAAQALIIEQSMACLQRTGALDPMIRALNLV